MSVLDFASGDKFILRIIKSLGTNPADEWANSYEFRANEAGSEANLVELIEKAVAFEAAFHHNVVLFQRAVLSTWEPDSVPYDPEAFITSTLSSAGGIGPVTDLIGLGQALAVSRVASSGRVGHLFYRGVLEEAEVSAPAGKTILTVRADIQEKIDDALTSSNFADFISATPDSGFNLVLINADGTQVRNVVGLFVQGVTNLPTDHAWFNRSRIVVP